jgi:hypothetical protein
MNAADVEANNFVGVFFGCGKVGETTECHAREYLKNTRNRRSKKKKFILASAIAGPSRQKSPNKEPKNPKTVDVLPIGVE